MIFAVECLDKADSEMLRMSVRPDHLRYLEGQAATVRLAGPLLSDAGGPVGSLLLVDCADAQAAAEFARNDPYALAGLFEAVSIRPITLEIGGV